MTVPCHGLWTVPAPLAALALEDVPLERLDAVEEEDPVEVVELVLEARAPRSPRLDRDLLALRRHAPRRRRVARRTFAVSSGIERQPSRPISSPSARTTRGFDEHEQAVQLSAFGWPGRRRPRRAASSSICGAASPTQWPADASCRRGRRRRSRRLRLLRRRAAATLLQRAGAGYRRTDRTATALFRVVAARSRAP